MFSSPLELRAKLTSYTDEKAFLPLPDEDLSRTRVQVLNLQVPRGSPATASSVDVHLALAGKSIPSYLVVDRRVQREVGPGEAVPETQHPPPSTPLPQSLLKVSRKAVQAKA